jgi:hypothetical protein
MTDGPLQIGAHWAYK